MIGPVERSTARLLPVEEQLELAEAENAELRRRLAAKDELQARALRTINALIVRVQP